MIWTGRTRKANKTLKNETGRPFPNDLPKQIRNASQAATKSVNASGYANINIGKY